MTSVKFYFAILLRDIFVSSGLNQIVSGLNQIVSGLYQILSGSN